jgi:hypothetical protein
MACIAMPAKYRVLGDFADYYAGRKKAPVLTIFIGGNHEASNYLNELYPASPVYTDQDFMVDGSRQIYITLVRPAQ